MKKFLKMTAVAAISLLPVNATAQSQVVDGFRVDQFRWTGAASTMVRWKPMLLDGELLICGSYSTRGAGRFRGFGREMMQRTNVRLNGQVVKRGVSHFSSVQSQHMNSRMVGQPADCARLGRSGTDADLNNITLDYFNGPFRSR